MTFIRINCTIFDNVGHLVMQRASDFKAKPILYDIKIYEIFFSRRPIMLGKFSIYYHNILSKHALGFKCLTPNCPIFEVRNIRCRPQTIDL